MKIGSFILLYKDMKRLLIISLLVVSSLTSLGESVWLRYNKVSSDSLKWRVEIGRINIDLDRCLIIIFSSKVQVYRITDEVAPRNFKVRDKDMNILNIEVGTDIVKVYGDSTYTAYKPSKP